MMLDPTAVSIAGIVTGGCCIVALLVCLTVLANRRRW